MHLPSNASNEGSVCVDDEAGNAFQALQYGRKRRKCFRYGNYHAYYGYRVGETLEDHRIAHFKAEWFAGKRAGADMAS